MAIIILGLPHISIWAHLHRQLAQHRKILLQSGVCYLALYPHLPAELHKCAWPWQCLFPHLQRPSRFYHVPRPEHHLAYEFSTVCKPYIEAQNNNNNNEVSKRAKQKGSTFLDSGNSIFNTTPAHPSVLKISGESFHDYYKHLDDYDDNAMKHGACLKWQFEMPSQLHSWPLDPWPCDKCPAVCW